MSHLFINQEADQLQFKTTDVTYRGTQSQTTTSYIFDFFLGIAIVSNLVCIHYANCMIESGK